MNMFRLCGILLIALYIAGIVLMFLGQMRAGLILWLIATVGGAGLLYWNSENKKRAQAAREAQKDERV